ncbi:hypothetical protein E0W68_03260 [Flavobacterium salilacus subsp. salilacus]|uniref:hypothetical protein n=1 Tax=Flavobacterium TaxID=237 RepID=UPI0010752B8D|nr:MULTISPECIES: hypothetical protein [Flavobacterium]KAF2519379.1 hypothetical protein E0W68_03260 [Flavobacterium salilacus subsp. salilacus]MBE1614729.1 hypothetical protein [Flavobacterium sp. SaA2.13]
MEKVNNTESCFMLDVSFSDMIVFESELIKNDIWFKVDENEIFSEEYIRKYVFLKTNSKQISKIVQDNNIQRSSTTLNGKATKIFLLACCFVAGIMLSIILIDYFFNK